MSSFDKTVKLACKPKAAPPKSKYLDPIIAATWSDDGAVHDVCKALVSRIREPNAVVVFKALIVLHTMIRAGSTDNVLSYLSSYNILKLRNISSANWEGYAAPQNLQNYALYLESRILAYKELKHDAIKVQSESNRDMRNSMSIEENTQRGRKDRKTEAAAPGRSKTIMGRKLRSMTVEKGLLRETKVVHRMIDALVECRFYLDNLEDELTITALQMLVKDLLILFQAGNEGVINVLEHYFEMSHVDAQEALKLYRRFCKQTENVVEYLGVAKKLQNLLNVSIPNLKHAPVSLAGALQEYLDDPNFEQNRVEYKMNKGAPEHGTKAKGRKKSPSEASAAGKALPSTSGQASSEKHEPPSASTSSAPNASNKDAQDFFSSIEEQPTIFNPQTNGPNMPYFHQQGANPFTQMLGTQPTGYILPQPTAMPVQPNPFSNFLTSQAPQPTGQPPLSTFVQQPNGILPIPQPAGLQAPQLLLQPQMTGSNPFRQSMLVPQTTGMQLFGVGSGVPPVPPMMNFGQMSNGLTPAPTSLPPFSAPKTSFGSVPSVTNVPARPSSTPLTSSTAATASSTLQSVKTHQTGTKNPFGPVSTPPVPKPPTLFELSASLFNQNTSQNQNFASSQLQPIPQQQPPQPSSSNHFNYAQSSLNPGAVDISSVASSFTFSNSKPSTNTPTSLSPSGMETAPSSTTGSDSLFSMSLPAKPTSLATSSHLSSTATPTTPFANGSISPISPVKSHVTGLAGLKPFKPTSSFGASLLESLPPITGSGPTTPAVTGNTSANNSVIPQTPTTMASPFGGSETSSATGLQNNTPFSNPPFVSNQLTGATGGFGTRSTVGVGLRPQLTGGGGANPFRASMAAGAFGSNVIPPMPPLPTGLGSMPFGGMGGSGISSNQLGVQSQQPNAATSLI